MFNPQARWDRNLPQENNTSGIPNGSLAVSCLFVKGKATPRYFIWKNRLYKVKKVNFFWQEQKGREKISYFSLGTSQGTYQISFSYLNLSWKMDKFITD